MKPAEVSGTGTKSPPLSGISSLVLTLAVTVFVLVGPMYSNGAGILTVMGYIPPALFIPIAVAGLGLLKLRTVKIVAAFLILAFAIIGGFSVGLFYLPVAFLMFLAAFKRSPVPEDPPP